MELLLPSHNLHVTTEFHFPASVLCRYKANDLKTLLIKSSIEIVYIGDKHNNMRARILFVLLFSTFLCRLIEKLALYI